MNSDGMAQESDDRLIAPEWSTAQMPERSLTIRDQIAVIGKANRKGKPYLIYTDNTDKKLRRRLFASPLGRSIGGCLQVELYALPALNPACSICSRAASAVEWIPCTLSLKSSGLLAFSKAVS